MSWRRGCFFILSVLCLVSARLPAHGSPIPATLSVPIEEPIHGYGLIDALPGLTFSHPVVIASPPAETNQLFIVERLGKIYALTNLASPDKTLVLDLAATTMSLPGMEPGLLGLAFHPGFASNRFVFVYRTVLRSGEGFYNRLSRFEFPQNGSFSVDPSTEQIVLQQRDFSVNQHNGGDIHFGPDGYLYLSIGDQSPAPEDWIVTRQPIDKNFFGAILRIDVDLRSENLEPNPHPGIFGRYRVPRDNPFVGTTNYHGLTVSPNSVRTEIFALGFRNPWRFCFDPFTGDMYCGDVGELYFEEVNLVIKGQNYGWPYKEAGLETAFYAGRPPLFTALEPTLAYQHLPGNYGGQAIIGGRVYAGNSIPHLRGLYLYGDNVRGNIWALHRPENEDPPFAQFLTGEPGLSTFGLDPRDNELLLATLVTGKIMKLVYRNPESDPFPKKLSETGLFTDVATLAPAPGVIPYRINVPFWSDHALKRRWFGILKAGSMFESNPTNSWVSPEGAFWVKHFELGTSGGSPRRNLRLETRLLMKNKSGIYGVTYKWNPAGTEAELVRAEGLDEVIELPQADGSRAKQTWHYPSRLECRTCHNEKAGFALGFTTPQLNCTAPASTENQLMQMFQAGYLSNQPPDPSSLPRLARATDSLYSAEYRVRSYFEANCSQCHRPGNPIIATWDARFHTPMKDKGILSNSVIPNSVETSMLHTRVAYIFEMHMPPISTSELDWEAIHLLREWITGFPVAPWTNGDLGTPRAQGNATVLSNTVTVAGYGPAQQDQPESGHFLLRPLQSTGQIVARIADRRFDHASTRAGIWLSSVDDPKVARFFAGITGTQAFIRSANGELVRPIESPEAPLWLRVTYSDGRAAAWIRQQGDWQLLHVEPEAFSHNALIGFAVTDQGLGTEQFARFQEVSFTTISLASQSNEPIAFGESINALCELRGDTGAVQKVQFYINGALVTEDDTAPYNLDFVSPGPGNFSAVARVVFHDGSTLDSDHLDYLVNPPAGGFWLHSSDDSTLGYWKAAYGRTAAYTPEFELLSSNLTVSIIEADTISQPIGSDGYALQSLSEQGHVTQTWSGTNILLEIDFHDSLLHLVSLYFERSTGDETLLVKDKHSNAQLYHQKLPLLEAARYIRFLVRGVVDVSIASPGGATLSGIFIDPAHEPAPVATLSEIPPELLTPARIPVVLNVATRGRLSEVGFLMNGKPFATVSAAPFAAIITNPPPGRHQISARLTDIYGQSTVISGPVFMSRMVPANARFLGVDQETGGNWKGAYGQSGFAVIGASNDLPSSVSLETSNVQIFHLQGLETNVSALQMPNGSDRIAAGWTHPWEFTFSLSQTDPQPYLMSLYFLDALDSFRRQKLELFDARTGLLLDAREIGEFAGGRYFRWILQASVRIRMTAIHGTPFLSGIFLDPAANEPGSILIEEPRNGASLFSPGRGTVALSPPDASVASIELYLDNELLSENFAPAAEVELPRVFPGEHWLSAAARDANGSRTVSMPIRISGTVSTANAEFLGVDSSTQGNWPGAYGREGHSIAGDSTNFSALFRTSILTSNVWTWAAQSEKIAAPKRAAGEGRVAAAWFASQSERLAVGLSLPDGESHQVALYLLDYDDARRVMNVRVLDSATGGILDERAISDFGNGKFMRWRVRGDVRFEILCANTSTILNAVFVDPLTRYSEWLSYHWSEEDRLRPEIFAEQSDPDGDQVPNFVEYAAGTSPTRPSQLWNTRVDSQQNEIVLTVWVDRSAADAALSVETSADLRTWLPAKASSTRTTHAQEILTFRVRAAAGSAPAFFRIKTDHRTR